MRKTLFIGLGGTGVASILQLKKLYFESFGSIPSEIKLLVIDTDYSTSQREIFCRNGSLSLDQEELVLCSARDAYNVYLTNKEKDYYSWLPDECVVGASHLFPGRSTAIRSNGRFLFYYNFVLIQNKISSIIRSFSLSSSEELTINVITSLAGGTGSGMLTDLINLIKQSLKDCNCSLYDIRPWLVLPDVYKAMVPGAATFHVFINGWAAIEEIDYLQHISKTGQPLRYGCFSVTEPLFDYAFVFGNRNNAGLILSQISDITQVISNCAFLYSMLDDDPRYAPGNDKVQFFLKNGVFDIENKKAWAASTGSAELIYDNQAVSRAFAYRIVVQLCDSMSQANTDGIKDTFSIVPPPSVIDALLSPAPEYMPAIDENTTLNDINSYISDCAGIRIDNVLQHNLSILIENTRREFEAFLSNLMDPTNCGCVWKSLQLIRSLKSLIGSCRSTMENEKEEFNSQNRIPIQWEVELSRIKRRGLKSFFGSKVNKDQVEQLTQELINHVTCLREEKRRLNALRFYCDFESMVLDFEQQLQNLHVNLARIHDKYSGELLHLQQLASSTSGLNIFLHLEYVKKVSVYRLDNSVKDDFHSFCSNNGGLLHWLPLSEEQLDTLIFNFAKGATPVVRAVHQTIDDILRSLSSSEVKGFLEKLRGLASPLWTQKRHGHIPNQPGYKVIIVGVGNRETSILSSAPEYRCFFDTEGYHAYFVNNNFLDRITITIQEGYSPIYSVEKVTEYREKASSIPHFPAYVDKELHKRIVSESFNVMPTVNQDSILHLWVCGLAFGFIYFDLETNSYCIRTKNSEDAINNNCIKLDTQRDLAFGVFKTNGLFHMVEDLLNIEVSIQGNNVFHQKFQQIKDGESYLRHYASISPFEQEKLDDPSFKAIRDLIYKEVEVFNNLLLPHSTIMGNHQNHPQAMPESLKCLVHGQTRTLVDILKAMNEESPILDAYDARERLRSFVSSHLRSGDSVARFVIRLIFRWLSWNRTIIGKGINLDGLEESLSKDGGDAFLMESQANKVYFDYCVSKLVSYIKFLNEFRRYTSTEQIKEDLQATIGFVSGCSSNCRNGAEYFFGFSRPMLFDILWTIERNQDRLFPSGKGLLNEELERLFFCDYAEKVDSLGFERAIKEVFRPVGCHSEWLSTVDVIGPRLLEVRDGEYEIMCGSGHPLGRDSFMLHFAMPLLASDSKYQYKNGYFVPKEDFSLPVYHEWQGRKLSFINQEEKEAFINRIPLD